MITGAGDNTARLWDVQTGKEKGCAGFETAVRSVQFSEDGAKQLIIVTDNTMGYPCRLMTFATDGFGSMCCFFHFRKHEAGAGYRHPRAENHECCMESWKQVYLYRA